MKRGNLISRDDTGTAARFFLQVDPDPFFYCAKASPSERAGCKFPTVKPLKLIKYLVTLITPPGGIVLDPFLGSGTTGIACNELGFDWVGIDLDTSFAEQRIITPQKTLIELGRDDDQKEIRCQRPR